MKKQQSQTMPNNDATTGTTADEPVKTMSDTIIQDDAAVIVRTLAGKYERVVLPHAVFDDNDSFCGMPDMLRTPEILEANVGRLYISAKTGRYFLLYRRLWCDSDIPIVEILRERYLELFKLVTAGQSTDIVDVDFSVTPKQL